MTVLTLSETRTSLTRRAIDCVVRSLPKLGPLRFGPWPAAPKAWIADAWTPGPELVLCDPWLSRLVGRATGLRAGSGVDSAGPREWLVVTAAGGIELLRCELMRESDFCAWDTLLDSLRRVPGLATAEVQPALFGAQFAAVCRAAKPHRKSVGRVVAHVDSGTTHLRCDLQC